MVVEAGVALVSERPLCCCLSALEAVLRGCGGGGVLWLWLSGSGGGGVTYIYILYSLLFFVKSSFIFRSA